jgi:sugar phosphate isomerase/epimerase
MLARNLPSRAIRRRDLAAAFGAVFLAAGRQAALAPAKGALKISVFSKHFHWTDWRETAAIARDIGFDGVNLTVRQGGHVMPERVREDLPRAADVIRSAGLELPMITTGIVDISSPHAEAILRTAGRLGIRYYRWGGFLYTHAQSIPRQLADFAARTKELVDLNKELDICGMYHTHSGIDRVGASIWDLWYIFRTFDPRYVGVNYDIGHATVEGGCGGWINSARLTAPMMRGVAVKDFKWGLNAGGRWQPQWCRPGEGMVNFAKFFTLLRASGFSGPFQLHYEYPELGGADAGQTKVSISRARFQSILRRDLTYMRSLLKEAHLL